MFKNYKRLKKTELLQKCQQFGIKHNNKLKRNELIQLLLDYELQINNEKLELEINQQYKEYPEQYPKESQKAHKKQQINNNTSTCDLEISITDNNTLPHQACNTDYNCRSNYYYSNDSDLEIDSTQDNFKTVEFTDHQEINKLTHLLQLIGLKNILDQNNTNNCDNSNDNNSIPKKEESNTNTDNNDISNNDMLSTLFYLLSTDFKKKILEKEEDWSQKKKNKMQDWEQYQLDKIQLITQRPCLSTQERFHLPTGNLVNIDTEVIKQQDDFFEYTEHFLTKQNMMEKTFYYTSKFESDAGGQAIRCMREAYQLLKYQLQFLLNRWKKHKNTLSKKISKGTNNHPQPLKEIYFINIIHGDIAEHYVKNLLYLKNQKKYQDICHFVIIGDLTYFALYWIQYHRENFVSWEKYQSQKENKKKSS